MRLTGDSILGKPGLLPCRGPHTLCGGHRGSMYTSPDQYCICNSDRHHSILRSQQCFGQHLHWGGGGRTAIIWSDKITGAFVLLWQEATRSFLHVENLTHNSMKRRGWQTQKQNFISTVDYCPQPYYYSKCHPSPCNWARHLVSVIACSGTSICPQCSNYTRPKCSYGIFWLLVM